MSTLDRTCSIDFETRSVVDLTDVNAYVYFDDPSTEAWCMAYCFDDDRKNVRLWWAGTPCPTEVADHIRAGGILNAWNAAFERLCFAKLMGPRHGWPVPKLEQWRCTMAAAYAMALPGKLEMAAPALGLDIRKDDAGHRLMLQMSKPRKIDPLIWWDDFDRMERLGAYCRQDVRTEMAVASRLLPLTESEQQVWYLDQKINDRGVGIDERLCLNAREVVREAARRLDAELKTITGYEVAAATNTGAIRKWLGTRGVVTDSIAKDVLAELLNRDDLPGDVRRVLEIRRDGGKSSTAKIDAMLARRQSDGRMRGNLQYHGASTGRWAARGAQLQNLPRPSENGTIPGVVNATIGILLEG
jgi:DNA polymerase bacteriophage-type